MDDELYRTVRIKIDQKDASQSGEQDAGNAPAKETEFELVSTMMLKQILESDDDQKKNQIRELADEGDGVLACSTDTDQFKIVLDEELEAAIKGSPKPGLTSLADGYAVERIDESEKEEDLALVSTQLLRVMLTDEDQTAPEPEPDPETEVQLNSFNPYDGT